METSSEHPAVAVVVGHAVAAQRMADLLYRRGIYALGFCHPVVPEGAARIRAQVTAKHTAKQLREAAKPVAEVLLGGGGSGVGACGGYVPRRPQQTVLHRAVREGLGEFLEEADGLGGLPAFVVKEFNAFLRCGDLALGFVRVRCPSCETELRIGFSCKGRTVCSSCTGRRAALTAAHLVDDVLPRVPIRQWTLAFPRQLRWGWRWTGA